jgi:hypothetical protein
MPDEGNAPPSSPYSFRIVPFGPIFGRFSDGGTHHNWKDWFGITAISRQLSVTESFALYAPAVNAEHHND